MSGGNWVKVSEEINSLAVDDARQLIRGYHLNLGAVSKNVFILSPEVQGGVEGRSVLSRPQITCQIPLTLTYQSLAGYSISRLQWLCQSSSMYYQLGDKTVCLRWRGLPVAITDRNLKRSSHTNKLFNVIVDPFASGDESERMDRVQRRRGLPIAITERNLKRSSHTHKLFNVIVDPFASGDESERMDRVQRRRGLPIAITERNLKRSSHTHKLFNVIVDPVASGDESERMDRVQRRRGLPIAITERNLKRSSHTHKLFNVIVDPVASGLGSERRHMMHSSFNGNL
ncbi:hypothetical protein J6590_048886 [Homalodisca vitripennis]|nr:hypothetical protein J6590_048886 [Homalodisca vitripennis]